MKKKQNKNFKKEKHQEYDGIKKIPIMKFSSILYPSIEFDMINSRIATFASAFIIKVFQPFNYCKYDLIGTHNYP